MAVASQRAKQIFSGQHLVLRPRDEFDVFIGYKVDASSQAIEPLGGGGEKVYVNEGVLEGTTEVDGTLSLTSGSQIVFQDSTGTLNLAGSALTNVRSSSVTTDGAQVGYVQTYVQDQIYLQPLKTQPVLVALDGETVSASWVGGALWFIGSGSTPARFEANTIGLKTMQSVSCSLGMRFLVMSQADAFQNGIYVVTVEGSASARTVATRAPDADTVAELPQYTSVLCINGTYPGQWFRLNSAITQIDVSAQNWVNIGTGDAHDVLPGNYIDITGGGRVVNVKLSTDFPGLTAGTDGGLRFDGPAQVRTDYLKWDAQIPAYFGIIGGPVGTIVHDSVDFLVTSDYDGAHLILRSQGDGSEIRVSDYLAVQMPNGQVLTRGPSSNITQRAFQMFCTLSTTTYTTMTFDGTAFTLPATYTQVLMIPNNTAGRVSMQFAARVTSVGFDQHKTFVSTLEFNYVRSGSGNVLYPEDGTNQTSGENIGSMNILNISTLQTASAEWFPPLVVPNPTSVTVPLYDYIQIQVRSVWGAVEVAWSASGTILYNTV